MKVAFIFPGQGSQYAGMGKDIAAEYDDAMDIYDLANETLGFNIKHLCFAGPETELMKTEVDHLALVTASMAILKAVECTSIKPEMMAGLSIGEYTALTASNVISFSAMLRLLQRRRGYIMQTLDTALIKGGIAALIDIPGEMITECIKAVSDKNTVEVANYNSPRQIIITGELEAVKEVAAACKKKGSGRVAVLPVSYPIHCSLLKGAAKMLFEDLLRLPLNEPCIPVISNFNALEMKKATIPELLKKQMHSPVMWRDSIEHMIKKGIDTFIEIGPNNTLTKLVRQINAGVSAYNVEDLTTLEEVVRKVK